MDWLWAALIGVGGSVIGGGVGGWFALLSARKQSDRDRQNARADGSHQAAMAIADAVASMDAAVVLWQPNPAADTEALRIAYGDCARATRVQNMRLTDQALKDRLAAHMRLTSIFVATAINGGGAARALSETVRRHTEALVSALDAHVSGHPLPEYQALDTTNRAALVSWGDSSGS